MAREGLLRRIVLGTRESVGGTVYGTIIVMATIAAGSHAEGTATSTLALIVGVTALVLWIAHVYASTLEESVHRGRRLDVAEFLAVARHELAIPLAAVAPVACLLLESFDAVGEQTAIRLALGFGVLTLAVQGARYAVLEHLHPLATLASISLNVMLGLVIVALEVAIH